MSNTAREGLNVPSQCYSLLLFTLGKQMMMIMMMMMCLGFTTALPHSVITHILGSIESAYNTIRGVFKNFTRAGWGQIVLAANRNDGMLWLIASRHDDDDY